MSLSTVSKMKDLESLKDLMLFNLNDQEKSKNTYQSKTRIFL